MILLYIITQMGRNLMTGAEIKVPAKKVGMICEAKAAGQAERCGEEDMGLPKVRK